MNQFSEFVFPLSLVTVGLFPPVLFNVLNPPSNGLLYNMTKYFYKYIYINPLVIKNGKMENAKSIGDVSIKNLNVGSPS